MRLRPRIQAADQQMRCAQCIVITTGQLLESWEIVAGQQFEMLADDLLRQRAVWSAAEPSSCSSRHSCALRAPTPVGSKCCR
jgi:hypothetical protein